MHLSFKTPCANNEATWYRGQLFLPEWHNGEIEIHWNITLGFLPYAKSEVKSAEWYFGKKTEIKRLHSGGRTARERFWRLFCVGADDKISLFGLGSVAWPGLSGCGGVVICKAGAACLPAANVQVSDTCTNIHIYWGANPWHCPGHLSTTNFFFFLQLMCSSKFSMFSVIFQDV